VYKRQLCNVIIALAKLGAAIWIARNAAAIILAGRSEASPLGMALSACLGGISVLGSLVAWEHVRELTQRGRSAIMTSQLISRTVKLRCAIATGVTLTVGATTAEPVVAAWADATGALIVAGLILAAAVRTIRIGLHDLLDRTVDPATRAAIERALARHRDAYTALRRIRARRSGTVVFVEATLGFDPALPLAEVDHRIAAVRAAITEEVAGADVSIVAGAHANA
jgi:divalent metal cation (Fe/Co/Zn/Cd) transporter